MFRNILLAVAITHVVVAGPVVGQESTSPSELAMRARAALHDLDFDKAAQWARKLVRAAPDDEYRLRAADTLLRCGRADEAVELFDQYASEHPDQKPYLWQRGIALYFVGRYADGAEQFEVHRGVNPNDVENAAWHYLCIAKKDSPEAADKLLLPAPGDPREPMEQVLAMFRQRDPQPVKDRLARFDRNDSVARSARFYGNLYLGLYADAVSDPEAARKHIQSAVKDAPKNYMGDVARVYAKHLDAAEHRGG